MAAALRGGEPVESLQAPGKCGNLKFLLRKCLTGKRRATRMPADSEGFPSGQRDQTVNLTSTTSKVRILPPPPDFGASYRLRGHSSVVEPQPSKLMMRVRFPLPAPSLLLVQDFAHVAQLVEHTLGKGEVSGSNPLMSSKPQRQI